MSPLILARTWFGITHVFLWTGLAFSEPFLIFMSIMTGVITLKLYIQNYQKGFKVLYKAFETFDIEELVKMGTIKNVKRTLAEFFFADDFYLENQHERLVYRLFQQNKYILCICDKLVYCCVLFISVTSLLYIHDFMNFYAFVGISAIVMAYVLHVIYRNFCIHKTLRAWIYENNFSFSSFNEALYVWGICTDNTWIKTDIDKQKKYWSQCIQRYTN